MIYKYALKKISPNSFGGGYRLVTDKSLKELFALKAKIGFQARVLRYWCYIIERTHKGEFWPDKTLGYASELSLMKNTLPIPDKEDMIITRLARKSICFDKDCFHVALPRRALRHFQRFGTQSQIKVFLYACLRTIPKKNNTFRIMQIRAAKELGICRKQVGLAIKQFKLSGFLTEIKEPLPITLVHGKRYKWT